VVGGSARLYFDKIPDAIDRGGAGNEEEDRPIVPWYMSHDLFFQKEFNLEAHLPPVVPLNMVNHILMDEKNVDKELLGLLKSRVIPGQGSLLSKLRIFRSEEQRIKWMQVYQSCDPAIGDRAKVRRGHLPPMSAHLVT